MYEAYISGADKCKENALAGNEHKRSTSYEAEDLLNPFPAEANRSKDRSATISFGSSIIAASPIPVYRKSGVAINRIHDDTATNSENSLFRNQKDRTPTFSEWGSNLNANRNPNNEQRC